MKMKYAVLTLVAALAVLGCKPQSESGADTNNLNSGSANEAPAAPATTNAPANSVPPTP